MIEYITFKNLFAIVIAVFGVVCYVLKKYAKKYWYIYMGRSKHSFLWHAVALCYEKLEMDDEFNGQAIPKIEDVATWNIDESGHGVLTTNDYFLRTNTKGGTDIVVALKNIASKHMEFANCSCQKIKNEGMYSEVLPNVDGSVDLLLGTEILGEVTDSDARFYITGTYENVLMPRFTEVVREYNKYKSKYQ